MKRKDKIQQVHQEGKRKKKKGRKWIILLVILVVVIVVLRIVGHSAAEKAGVIVNTTQATRGDLEESISNSGTVVSEVVKIVFAPASGNVDQVLVTAGEAVKQGDLLVSYDMDSQENTLRQAELQNKKSGATYQEVLSNNADNQAKLSEANTNIDVLTRQIEDNKSYLKDLQEQLQKIQKADSNLSMQATQLAETMQATDPSSQTYADLQTQLKKINDQLNLDDSSSTDLSKKISDTQELIADYETYKAKMESQKSGSEAGVLDQYQKTQYSIDKELSEMSYQTALEDYITANEGMHAEFNGIVTECNVVPGASLVQGTQVLTLESSEEVKVTFQASKHDLEKLAIGQQATVDILGYTYQGEVAKINRMASVNASGTPMVGVEVHLFQPDEHVILGMDAKIEVSVGSTKDALLIPVEAINADKEGDFLYIVEEGVAVRRPIVCGISSDLYVEVLEGLSGEEEIITTAMGDLAEGVNVTAIPQLQ